MAYTTYSIATSRCSSMMRGSNSRSSYTHRLLGSVALAGGLLEFGGAGKRVFHGLLLAGERIQRVGRLCGEHAVQGRKGEGCRHDQNS